MLITKTNRVNWKMAKKSFGLQFLEPSEVEDCFTDDLMQDCSEDQNCENFADYLLENYVTFDSKFTPDNDTESFHAHFNEQFYTSHPTLIIYIDILKKVQATTYVKLWSLDYQTPRKKVEKEKHHF